MGVIGRHTCRRLVELGAEVIGVDDLSNGSPDAAVAGVRYHAHSVTDVDPACRPYLDGYGTQTRGFCHIDYVAQAELRFTPATNFHAQLARTGAWYRDCYPDRGAGR